MLQVVVRNMESNVGASSDYWAEQLAKFTMDFQNTAGVNDAESYTFSSESYTGSSGTHVVGSKQPSK
jgi:hypothetical protein